MHCAASMKQHHWMTLVGVSALTLGAGSARAQDVETTTYRVERVETVEVEEQPAWRPHVLIEASGAYGVQFGTTDYLPSGAPGQWQHPIVHGFGVGGTAGVVLDPAVALVANYEYSNARSRHGQLTGVIDDVQGSIDYHTIVAGVRLMAPLPFGALQAELAGGVLLPYETLLEVTYGPALGQLPTPITGTGTRITHYSVGFGGHALMGYRIPLGDMFHLALNVKYRLFESENSGETTELNNFVTDYEALPPTATTATIPHGENAAQPTTNSVQDVRGQLVLGAMF